IRVQKQAKLEKEIYDEICSIQKKYKEKEEIVEENLSKTQDELEVIKTEEEINLEDTEREDLKDDTSIKISEKERDTTTTGISVEHKD
ncbi:MAG: hypothetical protein ACRCZR_08095, partial [Cetobacterium sp.]